MLSVIILSRRSYATMLPEKTIATPEVYFTRSSRTRDKALFFLYYQYIGTELSHDVLNPAHVPL